jgi:hypothetical protein
MEDVLGAALGFCLALLALPYVIDFAQVAGRIFTEMLEE